MEKFQQLFRFIPEYAGFVGVERECFIARQGKIVPIAVSIIPAFGGSALFGNELSACQLEERTTPGAIDGLYQALQANAALLEEKERELGFERLFCEVGPEDMPLDVYPDASGRYQRIARILPIHVLSAACRVIGTHVHVGMPNHEVALKVYNSVIGKLDDLCESGNGSFGERLALYRVMATRWLPRRYENWERFFEVATAEGFAHDPKRCWTLIRISIHGTIEFRMFGATNSLDRVVGWARTCHRYCMEAMM